MLLKILSLYMSIFEIVLISVRIYWNNFSNFYQKNEFIRIMVWEVKKNFKIHFKIAFSFCISCTLMLHDFPVVSVWCAWLRMHLLNLHFKLMKNEKIMISSALYRFNIVLCCLFLLIFFSLLIFHHNFIYHFCYQSVVYHLLDCCFLRLQMEGNKKHKQKNQ